jgi:hypothetical protein
MVFHKPFREKTKELTQKLNQLFETLINEEAYLLAKYLRNEKQLWKPRMVSLGLEGD